MAGDNVVSLAVQFSTCATSSTQGFEDKESATGKPTLSLENANAVTLSTFRAANTQPLTQPLYLALAAIPLLAGAAFFFYRRRRIA